MAVKPVPDGYHTVTPYLTVRGAAKQMDFLKQAFGAEETFRMDGPGGAIGHAEMRLGDSMIMLGDATPMAEATTANIHLYVPDVDDAYRRALAAGASSMREPQDMFYGDRSAGVKDAWGNQWWIATHVQDVPPEEMAQRAAAQRPL